VGVDRYFESLYGPCQTCPELRAKIRKLQKENRELRAQLKARPKRKKAKKR